MTDIKISLILGSHAHVPFGAGADEFEHTYTSLLKPFISGLYKYPRLQAALHYSGVLLYWVERSHPELFMLIEDMVARKQIEMLGGGFYEPMLPIIPLQDKIGQIELLTTYLRKQFGKRPQGCWIPAFAWEQNLVSPLAACGMGFTFLHEWQFVKAGGNTGNCVPCICEDQGKLITVFPVMRSLEEALAEKNIASVFEDVRDRCQSAQSGGCGLVVSIFPRKVNTGRNESTDIAWNNFFEELSLCDHLVETVTPGKLLKGLKDLPKLYFPDSAGCADGMSSRRFIVTYPEAGRIYAKMFFTNVLINQVRGDKSRKISAHEELWKAQGNSLFCSLGGNGLHNHALRNAAYGALLGAERVTREKGKFSPSLVPFDFNMDGRDEWLFQDSRINCYVQSLGGGIFELDYLPKTWNYLDTCGGRMCFADRLLPVAMTAENLPCGSVDGARLCCNERYEPSNLDKVHRKLRLLLGTASAALPFGNIAIEKTYFLKKDTVSVSYAIINHSAIPETFQFAPEIDLALPGEGDVFVRFFACRANQADAPFTELLLPHGADGLKIHDIKNEVQITLTVSCPFDGKIVPLYIPDDSAGQPLYQAYCVMPLIPMTLEPDESRSIEFLLKFSH